MKLKYTSTILTLYIVLGISPVAAQTPAAEEARQQANTEQEEQRQAYEEALATARKEEQAAMEAVEQARIEQARAKQEQADQLEALQSARAEQAEARREMGEARAAELAAMREELSRAHEDLRKASREVARMHRELDHAHPRVAPARSVINLGDRAVIGVVLGDSTNEGVEVLGVSPDGPSDRAGLKQGDVIISMMGTPLAEDESGDARAVLADVMEGVESGDEIIISVNRDGSSYDYTVTAEKREPFAWQSYVRLPSAPTAPNTEVIFEHIEIPEIDEEAIRVQVEKIREDVDRARVVIEADRVARVGEAPESWEYHYETFSDFGDGALREANVWFGLPVTRGLKLAEVDEGLGEYFKTDRGVLVLKAREDNDLQLQSGDVILQVGDKPVDKPSDVMRALREWEPGTTIEIGIKRDRKDKKLDVVLPEKMLGFDFAPLTENLHFNIHTSGD